jgi:RNA polymerase sigma factor (sigma-70 family)
MSDHDGTLSVYLEHRAALVDYATPIVGCPARAEDVVQEAYLRYAPAMRGGVQNPVAYLYRVVRNLALDLQRSLKPEHRRGDSTLLTDELPAMGASPEQQAVQQDDLRAVAEALATLPPRTRLAFELYRLEGLTLQQIAKRLEVSVSYVHELVRIAMTRCAEYISDDDEHDE